MSWIYLLIAGAMEVGWAVGMKYSHGFTRLWPSLATAVLMAFSVLLLALAIRHLPLGTAYAVWTGIGAVGTAAAGMVFFGDPVSGLRLSCLSLIVCGIVGLKLIG